MKAKRLFWKITLLFSLLFPNFSQARNVSIPDPNLAAAIRQEIGNSITTDTLLNLTRLEASNRGITDLTGLEHARHLVSLNLGAEDIKDQTVNSNAVSDVSPLSDLTELRMLILSDNNITDVSPLVKLTRLEGLSLWGNNISDVSPLTTLIRLEWLWLGDNNISDVSPLTTLVRLNNLGLGDNNISDVSALVSLPQLAGLFLWQNPLSYTSINTHIPAMQAKGVDVQFNPRTPTTLLKISGIAQEGVVNTALPLPFVVEVLDQDNQAFAGVPVTFAVATGRGRLDATTVRTDAIGRAAARLTLGRTVSTTTVRATAADISQPVQFTATAIIRSSPVMIPDANLRMKIMETLRKPLDETPTASDMLKLTTLTANDANIYDLTGLQHAANLTTLSLNNNYITEGVPLAALTQLTKLSLNNNSLWNLEPLTGLTELTTLSLEYNSLSDIKPLTVLPQLKTLHLRGNWLDNAAYDRHIPAMQVKGIDIRFDPRTEDPRPVVRIIYFYPSDREPLPDIDERIDQSIKDAQQFYADQMEAHGFDRKTFLFETDTQGRAVIHHVKGRLSHRDYQDDWPAAWQEAEKRFAGPNSFLFTVLDVDLEGITPCGRGGGNGRTGGGFVTARECFDVSTIAHELGHAFGLNHDYTRTRGKWIPSKYSRDQMMTSFCAAEWLDVIPIFNTGATPISHNTTIKILPPNLASPPNIIRFRFEVNDPDGIQQVQFFTNEPSPWAKVGATYPQESTELADYKGLKGTPDYTGEFFTTQLKPNNKLVILQSIDVHGNMTGQSLPADITSLLPSPKVVFIPDPHLASVVRDEISNITTHTILGLTALDARNHGITDLTGLEHAHNLKGLELGGEYIEGKGSVNSNTISDLSPLVGLSQLIDLRLSFTGISNISALADLTQLTNLDLSNNNISDIAPLEGLTQLTYLDLPNNDISDISPLSGLTQLTRLNLWGNNISDISPLAGLTQLTGLYLYNNNISDIAPLEGLTQLTQLNLPDNNISDIAPLEGLTQLTYLDLPNNDISDISPLSGLTQLTRLNLWGNNISDIAPLEGLTQLTYLDLPNNDISDIAPLEGLTQLTYLDLPNNDISDISPLSGLTQLKVLNLSYNAILDVSPLVGLDLPGTEWDSTGLYIWENPLSYASLNTHIPAMQAKGVDVQFNPRTPTTLVKISGAAQQGIVNTALPLPFVVEVRDQQNKAFAGVPVTFTVATGGGKLSATTVPTDATGRASASLTLGRTAGTTTIHVAATEIERSAQFTATAVLLSAPVAVSDVALHTAIASVLNKSSSSNLTVSDMLKLTTLTANNADIRELTGLEHASNLTTLSLNGNNLSNIAPLAGLSKLTTLSLNDNNISDVAPLARLAQLQTLSLENNNLADITPFSGLTALKTLSLDNNRLWNVSPLIGLSELRNLSLNNNDLSDVALLTRLTQLNTLQLKGNLLSYPSLHTHIPAIQAQGATVAVDRRTPTALVKASGTHGVASEALPVIVEVQDAQGLGFSGVPVTFTVTAGGGHLSASNVITDSTGRARTTLTLGITPGKNTVRAAAVEVQQSAIFTITAINANSPVTISDVNLRAKIVESLDKPINVQLTAGDLLRLTKLEAPNANIQNLIGLEHAHNLEHLDLSGEYIEGEGVVNSNTIPDFSPIAGFINLKSLDLSDCSLSNIPFLAKLTQLTFLWLSGNPISDVAPLAGLTELRSLSLYGTSLTDIAALSGLNRLTHLAITDGKISDLSPLKGLTQLVDLALWNNAISDISPLEGLTQLTYLSLGRNDISDLFPLSGLTQLTYLYLDNNAISDISPLEGLTQLKVLNLNNNAVLDVSPLAGLDLPGTEWDSTGLYIENNPLNHTSLNTHIPAMQAKGITVRYDLTLAKITGPWLWMIAPTERWQGGARSINVDSLAAASAGAVTEAEVAANGAKEDYTVGDYAWTLGKIAPRGGNNINDLLNNIGMAKGDIDDHSSYALITLESATAQSDVPMQVGSDDAIKVWLNGKVVHNNPIDRGASDFLDDFTVDLEEGDNLLLVKVSERGGDWSMFVGLEADANAVYKHPPDAVVSADVNGDGIVNIQDLVLVSSSLGQMGGSRADVNGDGIVNIQDLVMVAGALGQGTAASPTLHPSDLEGLTAAEVQGLLTQARQMALTDPAYLRGIAVLEQLLTLLLPKETALLSNYPNPFNPETWIPYQLSEPAEITLHIYAVNGTLVRTLALGHQLAGKYQSRNRAAYWDGRNEQGESVASGVYFYTLIAGDFTATRKMLIRK